METSLALFEDKQIRKVFHEGQWWFAVVDVVAAVTETANVTEYVKKMRLRDPELAKGWGQFVTPLSIETAGGKQRLNCASTEGILRIIQSISSPRAEPFKRWLAKVGYERVQEIDDPELASKRVRETYRAKGYSEAWIEKRLRGIQVREELTGEWKQRGVQEGKEYSILTAEISKATFGLTPAQYKERKGLNRENLRDHMTDLELIFSMLGEASTTEIARNTDAQGFGDNRDAAQAGGMVAGHARKELEVKSGKPVVAGENYLERPEAKGRGGLGDSKAGGSKQVP